MKEYRKVWVNRMDPDTGLRWMETKYVPVRRKIRLNWMKLVDSMMRVVMIGYLILWGYWAATVMIPTILK